MTNFSKKKIISQKSSSSSGGGGNETAATIAAINHGTSAKTTLVDADEVTGQYSENSFSLIRTTWLNAWVYISSKITYTFFGSFLHAASNKTTPVSADEVGVWNSATGDLNRVSITNLRTAFYQNITITSSATPTIDVCNYRDTFVSITALATAITSFVITGTPVDGNKLWIRYKDNGTARAISHSASGGGQTVVARGGILLTTTVTSKVSNEGFSWNAETLTWDCVVSNTEI